MNLFNPTALLKDKDKIWIQFYTLPEPNPKHYKETIKDSARFLHDKSNWRESKVSYPLKDECKEEFISELYGCIPFGENVLINLEKGISIDSIKERIELVEVEMCKKPNCDCMRGTCFMEGKFESVAILLPIQVEEKENQDMLWAEVRNIIFEADKPIKILMEKFNITLKK